MVKPWTGKSKHPCALVTLAAGTHGADLFRISGPMLRAYALRHGLDFQVLRGEPGRFPVGRKWELARYFPHYERIVMIDADVILAPDTPSLLDVVPVGRVGLHNDLPYLPVVGGSQWVYDQCAEMCRTQGYPQRWPIPAWNTGVWVADREHAAAFGPPRRPFVPRHCAEQNHIGIRLHQMGIPVQELPATWNWQWWWTKGSEMVVPVEGVHIYHYAGIEKPEERLRQMRELKARLYPEVASRYLNSNRSVPSPTACSVQVLPSLKRSSSPVTTNTPDTK